MNRTQVYQPRSLGFFTQASVIYEVDFPIFYVECLSERHIIIAGGGGSSKTGVHNTINIFELIPDASSCRANLVMNHHTPKDLPDAIMSGSLMTTLPIANTRLFAGGASASMHNITFDAINKIFAINEYSILRDRSCKTEQKCVKTFRNRLLTGSTDGLLTIWSPNKGGDSDDMHVEARIDAHQKAIDEIDIDIPNHRIVTLSRDEGRCAVWNINSLKLEHEFEKEYINSQTNGAAYKTAYRSVKYAYHEDIPANSRLFIAVNPVVANNRHQSKIYKTNASFKTEIVAEVTTDGIMTMKVSRDGKLVAIGTRTGSVKVFESEGLRKLYQVKNAHTNAVTNLEFLHSNEITLRLANSQLCPLLSVSIDRRVVLHRPQTSSRYMTIGKIIATFAMICLIFWFVEDQYNQ